ncbi:MAG: hypothetical protein ACJAXQ_000512 [Parvibaculaceae bacterium]|jgi:hypothetical protein
MSNAKIEMNDVLGSWVLLSCDELSGDTPKAMYGATPQGQIQYTDEGRMSAFLMNPNWPTEGGEATRDFNRFLSYAGTWELKDGKVHHQVTFCSLPSMIGQTLVRSAEFVGDELHLRTEPRTSKSGKTYVQHLRWARPLAK